MSYNPTDDIAKLLTGLPKELNHTAASFEAAVCAASIPNQPRSYALYIEQMCKDMRQILETHRSAVSGPHVSTEDRAILNGQIGRAVKTLCMAMNYGARRSDIHESAECRELITIARQYLRQDPWANH